MATPQQIQQAMRLAMADGDQEAVAELRGLLTEAYRAETPDAAEGMSGLDKFRAGIGQGMTNIARQAGNLVGLEGYSDADLQDAARRDRALLDTGAGKAGSFIGEIAATAPVGGLAGAGARAGLARVGLPLARRGALQAATMGATQGAAEGTLTAGPDSRAAGALAGAAGGALLPMGAGWVGRKLTRGVEPTAAARGLLEQGVDLTPAQMNPRSGLGQVEGAAKSLPWIGGWIENAQDAARSQWRGAARKQGLAPGAADASSMEALYKGYGPAYDAGKGFPVEPRIMRTAGGDVPLADFQRPGALTQAARDRGVWAADTTRDTAESWLQAQLSKLPGKGKGPGTMDSDALFRLRSDIRDRARAIRQSPNPDDGALAILDAAESRVTEALGSQLPKNAMEAVGAADRKYRVFKQLEKAEDSARSRGSSEFTPTELARQANKGDNPELWRLANQGKQTFDAGPPPTGARGVTLALPGLAAAATGAPVLGPAVNLAVLGGLVGTKTGRKLAGGRTLPQRKAQALATSLRRKAGLQGRDLASLYSNILGAQTLADFYGE